MDHDDVSLNEFINFSLLRDLLVYFDKFNMLFDPNKIIKCNLTKSINLKMQFDIYIYMPFNY